MNLVYAFLFCGIVCALGQLFLENTKKTPGDLNTILVITGIILTAFGIYDVIVDYAGAGAIVLIMNFGHVVFEGAYNGLIEGGFLGLLTGLLSSSAILSATIIISFIVTIIFKPKN